MYPTCSGWSSSIRSPRRQVARPDQEPARHLAQTRFAQLHRQIAPSGRYPASDRRRPSGSDPRPAVRSSIGPVARTSVRNRKLGPSRSMRVKRRHGLQRRGGRQAACRPSRASSTSPVATSTDHEADRRRQGRRRAPALRCASLTGGGIDSRAPRRAARGRSLVSGARAKAPVPTAEASPARTWRRVNP